MPTLTETISTVMFYIVAYGTVLTFFDWLFHIDFISKLFTRTTEKVGIEPVLVCTVIAITGAVIAIPNKISPEFLYGFFEKISLVFLNMSVMCVLVTIILYVVMRMGKLVVPKLVKIRNHFGKNK